MATGVDSRSSTEAEDAQELPPIPERYIRGCLGDMVEAERRWRITVEWRRAQGVDAILQEKFPEFARIKEFYPHFVYKRSKDGHMVYYERLGKIDIAKMRAHGISMERLIRYYIFLTEFMWNHLDPRPEGKVVTVMDVEGVGLKDLQGEALQFMRTASDIMQEHYVERSAKILVINAPLVFSLVWKVVSPWINERTRAKISIVGGDYKKKLSEFIELDHIPAMYGGRDPRTPYESSEECALRQYVESLMIEQVAVAAAGEEGAALTDGGIPEISESPKATEAQA